MDACAKRDASSGSPPNRRLSDPHRGSPDAGFYSAHFQLTLGNQRENAQELTNCFMLQGSERQSLTGQEARKMVLRLVPVVIVITLMIVYASLG